MYDRRLLAERLQRAMLAQRWSEVRRVAQQLQGSSHDCGAWRRLLIPFFAATKRTANPPTAMTAISGQGRFRLWIDAVGGYLVCLNDEIVLGQAVPEGSPDVPILGDLSRRHAVIHRDEEGYVIEPVRGVKVDGKTIQQSMTLTDGRVIELGNGVRLRFQRPHPLSGTARLEFRQPSSHAAGFGWRAADGRLVHHGAGTAKSHRRPRSRGRRRSVSRGSRPGMPHGRTTADRWERA